MSNNFIELESKAWIDPLNDMICVRVRRYRQSPGERPIKEGVIIRITEEMMAQIAEGMQYPTRGTTDIRREPDPPEPPDNRFLKAVDES